MVILAAEFIFPVGRRLAQGLLGFLEQLLGSGRGKGCEPMFQRVEVAGLQPGRKILSGLPAFEQARIQFVDRRVAQFGQGLLLLAGRSVVGSIVSRVLDEVVKEAFRIPNGPTVRLELVGGAAAYPEDGDRAALLRTKAETALQLARSTGSSPQWPPDPVAASVPAPLAHSGSSEESGPDPRTLLDPLTGVLAENQLGSALQKYVAQCRRDERPVSVICLDVDFLRRYNDQYGRRTGDQLLKHVADYLKQHTREQDLIARHAGDQFVLAMPANPTHALAVGQRLWSGLRRTAFEGSGPGLRMTVTLGVASFPDHGLIGRELFESAQLALRVAKSKGRNQCLMFQEAMRKMAAAEHAGDAF